MEEDDNTITYNINELNPAIVVITVKKHGLIILELQHRSHFVLFFDH